MQPYTVSIHGYFLTWQSYTGSFAVCSDCTQCCLGKVHCVPDQVYRSLCSSRNRWNRMFGGRMLSSRNDRNPAEYEEDIDN